jgi:hypothetical protein
LGRILGLEGKGEEGSSGMGDSWRNWRWIIPFEEEFWAQESGRVGMGIRPQLGAIQGRWRWMGLIDVCWRLRGSHLVCVPCSCQRCNRRRNGNDGVATTCYGGSVSQVTVASRRSTAKSVRAAETSWSGVGLRRRGWWCSCRGRFAGEESWACVRGDSDEIVGGGDGWTMSLGGMGWLM